MGTTQSKRLLIVGLDGLNWQLLEPFVATGVTPNLARLRSEGAWGPLTSVIPTQSATAWASFITGQNPARHGILDFMVRQSEGTYRHAKPHPATTLWHHAGRGGLRVGVFNFPVTYPPDPVNGFLVSGMLSPQGRAFTFPSDLADDLLAAVPDYRLDLEWQLYRGREAALLHDLTDMTRRRAAAARYLHQRFAPDLMALAFIGPDRLQHALWRHLDPSHPDHDRRSSGALGAALHGFYRALDASVGDLVSLTVAQEPEATVLVVSDHGFQPAAWQFRVDDWLASRGWLARKSGQSRLERWARRLDTPGVRYVRRRLFKDISRHFSTFAPGGTVDWSRTAAFGAWNEQQGIRLNVRGREPCGIVALGTEYESLRDQIAQALLEAAEPRTGLRAVDRVWRREELYSGPLLDEMPDLVFTLRPGFASSPMKPRLWDRTGWASGDHSLEGLFIAWGGAIQPGRVEGARLIDVAPTSLHLLGLPVPEDMDGTVLTQALESTFLASNPIRRSAPLVLEPDPLATPPALTEEEERRVREQLRGLGYL